MTTENAMFYRIIIPLIVTNVVGQNYSAVSFILVWVTTDNFNQDQVAAEK